jgi:hypothetical protein
MSFAGGGPGGRAPFAGSDEEIGTASGTLGRIRAISERGSMIRLE